MPEDKKSIMNEEKRNRVEIFLIVQSILCILPAMLLIASVIGIYRDGAALHAEDPLAAIFTREIIAERILPAVLLIFAMIGSAAAGLILGVKDENGLKPAAGGKVENRAHGGNTIRKVLLIAAIVLIAAGIFNGSAMDVLGKAIKICTECVGLG